MDKGKPTKFFKAYVNNQCHKIFLDDVTIIYKVARRKTPPLLPYFHPSKPLIEDTD